MNREDCIRELAAAAEAGTLLTEKHDPSSLSAPRRRFRTVTCMPPAELSRYIALGEFGIRVFVNHDPRHSELYWELIPRDLSVVPGSGVPSMSTTPTIECNRFVAVSGADPGLHLFAETAANIRAMEHAGTLSLTCEFL